MKKRPQTLSLALIVKNEEVHLPNLLETAHIYADEIVIVDTGSTDKTKEIARKYTNRIFDFPWVDDFSKARNFGLEKCTSDFIIWLDADDLVSKEMAQAIRDLKTTPIDWDVLYITYTYARNSLGKATQSQTRERIFRNNKGMKFKYPVHECLDFPQGLKYEHNHHIEIVHNKIKSVEPSNTRNVRILTKAVETEEYKNSVRIWSLLAREAEPQKAIAYYTHILNDLCDGSDKYWRSQMLVHFAIKLLSVQNYGRALKVAGEAIVMCPIWREPFFYAAQAYFHMKQYREMLRMLLIAGEIPPPPADAYLMYDLSIYGGDTYYDWLFFAYHYLWDREKAREVVDKVLRENPESPIFLRLKEEKRDWLYPKDENK